MERKGGRELLRFHLQDFKVFTMLMGTVTHKKKVPTSLEPSLIEPLAGSLMEHALGNAALSTCLLSLVSPVWGLHCLMRAKETGTRNESLPSKVTFPKLFLSSNAIVFLSSKFLQHFVSLLQLSSHIVSSLTKTSLITKIAFSAFEKIYLPGEIKETP